MKTGKRGRKDGEWQRLCAAMTRDSIKISVPRAFLSTLTLFYHHVSDAMAGDDRPDHGLAMIRQDRDHYRTPFYFVYGKLKRAEEKMSAAHYRRAVRMFSRYLELAEEQDKRFRKAVRRRGTASRAP